MEYVIQHNLFIIYLRKNITFCNLKKISILDVSINFLSYNMIQRIHIEHKSRNVKRDYRQWIACIGIYSILHTFCYYLAIIRFL